MSTIVIDAQTAKLLRNSGDSAELRDTEGNIIGVFKRRLYDPSLIPEFDQAELDRRAQRWDGIPHAEARRRLESLLDSGTAYEKFCQMVTAQGGDLDSPRLRAASCVVEAREAGYLVNVDTEAIGYTIIELGGGRKRLGDALDFSVGIEMLARVGDSIEPRQPLARVFARPADHEGARRRLLAALTIAAEKTDPWPLIVECIEEAR